jgi:hypothetical protein
MDIFLFEILAVIAIFIMIIYPIMIFIPWYTWWNTNDPNGNYSCFPLASIAYYKYNNPVYRIWDFLLPNPRRFKYDWWIIFISGVMTGEAVGFIPGGLCTPKTLCESLVPDSPPIGLLPGIKNGHQWPLSGSDWQTVLMGWLGISQVPTSPDNYKPNTTTWADQNNFLNKWGISPYSKAVIGFITNGATWNGDQIYATTLNPLLGIQASSLGVSYGGWFGFLQEGDNFGGNGLDEANRAVWANELPPARKSQDPKQGCSVPGIVSGGISMGIAGAFAGAAAGSPVFGIGAVPGAVIGFFVGALGGSALGAWQGKCL